MKTALNIRLALVLSCMLGLGLGRVFAGEIVVVNHSETSPVRFGLRKLAATVATRGDLLVDRTPAPGQATITVRADASELGPDGFTLAREGRTLSVTGGDARGAMYGVLDVEEQIRLGTPLEQIAPRTVRARFPFRAIRRLLLPAVEQDIELAKASSTPSAKK